MRTVLKERELWGQGLIARCKSTCDDNNDRCCAVKVLSQQDDFKQQKPLLQEVIEAAGHKYAYISQSDAFQFSYNLLNVNIFQMYILSQVPLRTELHRIFFGC